MKKATATGDPLIYIIVLNWNGKKILFDCLSSLIEADYTNKKMIVVDNHSTDGSPQYVRKQFPAVLIIENAKNLGWSGGNNIGIAFALDNGADAVFLLNPDTKIEKNAVKNI